MVDHRLYVKAYSTHNCTLNRFCTAKLSMLCGFTKAVSVDILYLQINDILEYNPLYVQSNFTCNSGPMFSIMLPIPSFELG